MKQISPIGGIMPPSVVPPSSREGGQPAGEVDPIALLLRLP